MPDQRGNKNWIKGGASPNPSGRPKKREDAAPREDGWTNVLTGIGYSNKDRRLSTEFAVEQVTHKAARDLWAGNDLAARIIEARPHECLRQGYEVCIEKDKDRSEELQGQLDDLQVDTALETLGCYENAYGLGAAFLGVNDGVTDLKEPLDPARVKGIEFISVFEAEELTPLRVYNNPLAPKRGWPSIYQINPISYGQSEDTSVDRFAPAQREIHESRFIVFGGIRPSQRTVSELNGAGHSILTRVWPTLRDFGMSWESAAILLSTFTQDIYKMPGLAALVAADKANVLRNRMLAVHLSKSIMNGILLDKEEEYIRTTTSVAGMSELLQQFALRLAAAAGIPVEVLMGQAPAGLNATGDSTIRLWYDTTKSIQRRKYKPAIERIVKLLMGNKEPDAWSVKFNPLWQETDAERAASRKIQMETDIGYIGAGVASPEEIAVNRFGGDEYSYETRLDLDQREADKPTDEDLATNLETPAEGVAPIAPLEGDAPANEGETKPAAPKKFVRSTTPGLPEDPADKPDPVAERVALDAEAVKTAVAMSKGMAEIAAMVADKTISRESGRMILSISYKVSPEQAEAILGPESHVAPTPPAPMLPGQKPPGAPPAAPGDKPDAPAEPSEEAPKPAPPPDEDA
jgi:phage-related protein (TIGR01555 family)